MLNVDREEGAEVSNYLDTLLYIQLAVGLRRAECVSAQENYWKTLDSNWCGAPEVCVGVISAVQGGLCCWTQRSASCR